MNTVSIYADEIRAGDRMSDWTAIGNAYREVDGRGEPVAQVTICYDDGSIGSRSFYPDAPLRVIRPDTTK